MAEPNTKIAHSFPPDNVSAAEKNKKSWGLQTAQAIWYHNAAYGPALFYNKSKEYEELIDFAFGKHSEDLVKPAVGINGQNQERSFVGGIDWSPNAYAVKRINSTVAKIFNRQYDPVATAIDPTSSDKRESFKAQVKAWMDNQQWMLERQKELGLDLMPEGMDVDSLPLNDEALNIYMQQDFKLIEEINLELGIKYQMNRNNFDVLKEKADFFITALPVAGVWCGLDSNNMPEVKLLNPRKIIAPYSEYMDFKRMAYCGYVDDFTVAEFRKLVGGEIPKDELDLIIQSHAKRGNYESANYSVDYSETQRDVDKITVLHFEVAQTDEFTYLERQDKFGNQRFVQKPYDYYRGKEDSFQKKYNGSRAIHRVPKPTTYGGYWIVGSDVVFGWGEKNYCKGELGYKLRASNMVDGKSTCLVEQIIPKITAIERWEKKVQMIVAAALPATVTGIDLNALRKAQFKMDGNVFEDDQLLDLLFQKGIIVYDTSDWGPGSTREPFKIERGGLGDDLGKYLDLIQYELNQLDEIIGYNKVTTASTLSPETGARVAHGMEQATDTALDHLYRADRGLCLDIFKALGHLHRISVQRNPDKYVPILGEEAVARIIMSASYDEYGIDVEARPTQQEWNLFYDRIENDERLSPEDMAAVTRCQSLKQAYAYLKAITKKKQKELQQFELQKIQETTNQAQASAQLTIQGDMAKLQFERETELMIRNKEMEKDYNLHKYKMEELQLQGTILNEGKIAEAVIDSKTKIEVAEKRPNKVNTKT